MDKWAIAEQEAEKSGSGGDFIKLEDKQSITIAVLGEPELYKARPFKEGGTPATKVLLNVFLISDKPPTLKVWDMAAATFKDLVAVKNKFPFAQWPYTVTRSGLGKKTRYKVLPEVSQQLTPAQQAKLAALELRDLVELAAKIDVDAPDRGDDESDDRAPRRGGGDFAQQGAGAGVDDDSIPF